MTNLATGPEIDLLLVIGEHHLETGGDSYRDNYRDNYRSDHRDNYRDTYRGNYRENYRNDNFRKGRCRSRKRQYSQTLEGMKEAVVDQDQVQEPVQTDTG